MTNRPLRSGLIGPLLLLFGAFQFGQACGDRTPEPPPNFRKTGGAGGDGPSSGGEGPMAGSDPGGASSGGSAGDGAGGHLPPPTCANLTCQTGSCIEEESGPRCECPSGFGGAECNDVNECTLGTACVGAECFNGFGAYYCGCDVTELLSGETCMDLDECDFAPCSTDATCSGEGLGFTCECKDGFFGNGFDCVATDPCAGDPCGTGATCVATSAGAICQCPLGLGGADCSMVCDSLSVADPALQARLVVEFGKYPEDIDPATDFVNRNSLDLSGTAVKSLDGLECWTNLERLNLNNTPLGAGEVPDPTPLEALKSLTRLRELHLSCANAPDLTVLSGHPALETLNLSIGSFCASEAEPATDLAPLATLKRLRDLDVSGQSLGDGSVLSTLRALSSLTASRTGLTVTTGFQNSRVLRSLYLDNNSISDVSGLTSHTLLVDLSLAQNELDSVDFVASLEHLTWLDIAGTSTTSVKELPSGLRRVDASTNQISSISSFAAATGLTQVNLASNQIKSLAALDRERHVGDYSVTDNPLDCEIESSRLATLRQGGLRITTKCDAAP